MTKELKSDIEKVREIAKNSNGFNVYEFLELANNHKLAFIGYMELVINKTGRIYLAIPSHFYKLIELIADQENKSVKDIEMSVPIVCSPLLFLTDKYEYVNVWYNSSICGRKGINRFQKKVLTILKDNGLIDDNFTVDITSEYHLYMIKQAIERKECHLQHS